MTTSKRKRARRKVPPVVRPFTPRELALYRVKLYCKIGRDAIEGNGVSASFSAVEYAILSLLHAVEDIARAMEPNATNLPRSEAE